MKKLLLIPLALTLSAPAIAASYDSGNYGYNYSGANEYDETPALKAQIAQLTETNQQQADQIQALIIAVEQLTEQNQNLEARAGEADALRSMTQTQHDEIVNLNNQVDTLTSLYSHAEADLEKSNADLTAETAAHAQTTADLNAANQSIYDLNDQVQELQEANGQLLSEVTNGASDAGYIDDQISQFYYSGNISHLSNAQNRARTLAENLGAASN